MSYLGCRDCGKPCFDTSSSISSSSCHVFYITKLISVSHCAVCTVISSLVDKFHQTYFKWCIASSYGTKHIEYKGGRHSCSAMNRFQDISFYTAHYGLVPYLRQIFPTTRAPFLFSTSWKEYHSQAGSALSTNPFLVMDIWTKLWLTSFSVTTLVTSWWT